MKQKKSLLILYFIKELIKRKKISLKEFSNRHDISLRSAQRYIVDIKEVFGDIIQKEDDYYLLIDNEFLKDSIFDFNKEELEKFIDLAMLVDDSFIDKLDHASKAYLHKLQKSYSDTYFIKNKIIEKQNINTITLKNIKKSIQHRRYISLEYVAGEQKYTYNRVKPLKIVIAEGNYYLACMTDDEINNGFKFLRISFIKDVKLDSETYNQTLDILEAKEFIKKFQTLFSRFDKKDFEVIVEVDSSVKRFFLQKNFLSSQRIISNKDNLTLSFTVTNNLEILPLIKKWLPNIKIIKPLNLRDALLADLDKYIEKNKI